MKVVLEDLKKENNLLKILKSCIYGLKKIEGLKRSIIGLDENDNIVIFLTSAELLIYDKFITSQSNNN